jgi:hypothetical protein
MRDGPSGTGLPRRGILRALALAPAALAACAGPSAERAVAAAGAGDAGPPRPTPGSAPSPPPRALAAVRAFELAADAEPAFSFRAAAARPGEPR